MAMKLKGFDFKQLALKHAEKLFFGLMALLALFALLGTKWMPYNHVPAEITQKVAEAEGNIQQHSWPEDEQQKFIVPEDETVEALVRNNIRKQIDPTRYDLGISFYFDPYATDETVTEPPFMPVESLIADAGRLVMAATPDEDLLADAELADGMNAEETVETEEVDESIPEEFRTRSNVTAAGPGGYPGAGPGYPGAGPGYPGGDYASEMASQYMDSEYEFEQYEYGSYEGGYEDGESPYGYGGMAASNANGRGLRYVAVRGIIPLREQLFKYKKAMHVSFGQARQLYEVIDFELQRQKMQTEGDPWGGEWEETDIEIAKEVLLDAVSFDPEVVKAAVTDSAVTMPLPGLVMGIWKSRATHPRLEEFKLSDDEIQQELEYNRRLVMKYREEQATLPEEPVKKGGFSDMVYDNRQMTSALMGEGYGYGGESYEENYSEGYESGYESGAAGYGPRGAGGSMASARMTAEQQELMKELSGDLKDEDRDKKLLEYIQTNIGAEGDLLLFRYFDFDVEPGAAYRYRVRLQLRNPNYGRPISQVGGLAHVVEGQTRTTDWSEVTEPVSVRPDVDFFVQDVKPARGMALPTADLLVYQWDPDLGTTIRAPLKVELGQEIGGIEETHQLDPAKQRYEIEPYTFKTGDLLVDSMMSESIRSNDHPDLRLPAGSKSNLALSQTVLVAMRDGGLAAIDQLTRVKALEARQTELEYERKPFEDLKNAEKAVAAEGLFGEYGAEYSDYAGGEGGYEGGGEEGYGYGQSRGRNTLRRGSSRTRGRTPTGGSGYPGSGYPGGRSPSSGRGPQGRPGPAS